MTTSGDAYHIERIQNTSGYDMQRGAHRRKQIHFRQKDGTLDYVEVPIDEFTPQNVQAALDHAVALHEAVKGLTPGSIPNPMVPNPNPFG